MARFEESGSILQGTKKGRSLGFEIELSLGTEAPQSEVENLIRQAHQMCFTQDVIANRVRVHITQRINDKLIEVSLSDEENGPL